MPRIHKHPFEQFTYTLLFDDLLAPGDTVQSVSSVTSRNIMSDTDSTAEIVVNSAVAGSPADGVALEMKAGKINERHSVEVKIVTGIGEKLQGAVLIDVIASDY